METTKVLGIGAIIAACGLAVWQLWPKIADAFDGDDDNNGGGGDTPPADITPSVAAMITVTATNPNRTLQEGGEALLNVKVKNHTVNYTAFPTLRMFLGLSIPLGAFKNLPSGTSGDPVELELAPGQERTIQLTCDVPPGWSTGKLPWTIYETSSGENVSVARSTTSNDFMFATPESLEFLACQKVTSGNYMWPGESVTIKVQVSNPSTASVPLQIALEYLFERATSTYHDKAVYSALTIEPGTKWYSITMTMPHWDLAMQEDIKDYGTVKCKIWQKKSDGSEIVRLQYPDTPTWIFIRGDDESKLKFNSCSIIGDSIVGPGHNAICGLNVTNSYPVPVKLGLLMRLGGDATFLADWMEDLSQLSPKEVTLPAGTNTVSLYRATPNWDRPGNDIKDGGRMECEIYTFNLVNNTLRKLIVYSPIFTSPSMMQGIISPRWTYDRDL